MKVAVAKEIAVGENRVALVPEVAGRLVKQGIEVLIESGAGDRAFFSDDAYAAVGATIVPDAYSLWSQADILLKLNPPQGLPEGGWEADRLKPGAVLISFLNPLGDPQRIQALAERQITTFAMEMIPRTTRAQSMDALSSQASVVGYKAVLIAATVSPKFFPMLTTAAGTIPPAKVLVMGAGVAGLQAIATARRLGAVVEGFDIRPEVKEEVQSLGARFVEVDLDEETCAEGGYACELSEAAKQKEREVITAHVAQSDVVITAAQVQGRRAPILVTEDMVQQMKPGSVLVDLAAEQGGNCACTEPGKDVKRNGVTIIGPMNLASAMPVHASQMYAKNLAALLQLLIKDQALNLNFEDDIIRNTCVAHAGQVTNQRVQDGLAAVQNQPSAVS